MREQQEIYLVPSDTSGAATEDVHVLHDGDMESDALSPSVAVSTVLEIVNTLVRDYHCPTEAVGLVLAFADIHASVRCETDEARAGSSDMNEAYLRLDFPSIEELALPQGVSIKCVGLVVDCTSRDQGWASSENEYDGTYRASCSWSEVTVEQPLRAVTRADEVHCDATSDDNEDSDGERANSRQGTTIWDSSVSNNTREDVHEESTDGVELARVEVCRNARATSKARHHRRYFKDPRGLIQHIKPANSVVLVLRSQYPGWENTATYARLEACFSLEFAPDFFVAGNASSKSSSQLALDDFHNPAFANSCRVQ